MKPLLTLIVFLVISFSLNAQVQQNTVYYLKNGSHWSYLNISGVKHGDNVIHTSRTSPGAEWEFINLNNGYFQIRNIQNRLYVANFGNKNINAPIRLVSSPGDGAQWSIQGNKSTLFLLKNKLSGYYLSSGGNRNDRAIMVQGNEGQYTYWDFVEVRVNKPAASQQPSSINNRPATTSPPKTSPKTPVSASLGSKPSSTVSASPPQSPSVAASQSPPVTVNTVNPQSKTAKIHDATRELDYEKVESLVNSEQANVNVKDGVNGRTALHYAAINNSRDSREIMQFLITSGDADINARDNSGKTPLDLALERSNFDGAKTLLQNNANARLASSGLERIIAIRDTELLKLMLQNGADANLAMNKAIEADNVEMLNTVLDNSSSRATNQMFEKAVNIRSQQTAIELLLRGVDKDQAMDFVIQKKDKSMVELVLGTNVGVASATKALVFAVEQRDMNLAQSTIESYNANPTSGMKPAVDTDNLQMVQYLLGKGADPNDQMENASAAGKNNMVNAFLYESANPDRGVAAAANNNRTATLQILLDAGGDANLAMPIAIEKGNVSMVNMCIAAPKPADVYRSEYIITTCKKSNLDILNSLLLAGADPNPGMPISIGKKDVKLVRELIIAGAEVNKPEYLMKSAELMDAATAQLLLENGANPNPGMPISVGLNDATMVNLMLQMGADAYPPELISKASGLGNTSIAKMLLDAGADANNGMATAVKNNREKVVALLLQRGADGSKDVYITSSVVHNNPSLVRTLIEAGGNINLALEPAINVNSNRVVQFLSDNGIDITDTNNLVICVNKNFVATAKVIVAAGGSASEWWDDGKGKNLLHISIENFVDAEMVSTLLTAGVDPDTPTSGGDSPLHVAVAQAKNHKDKAGAVVVALINANANVNAKNAKGETVLKAAPSRRPVTKPLKDAGAKRRIRN